MSLREIKERSHSFDYYDVGLVDDALAELDKEGAKGGPSDTH